MHVHVSPDVGRAAYTVAQLECMLKAIAFYDQAITKVMPAERKRNTWAEGNPLARGTDGELKSLYQAVPARGWGPLFQKYNDMVGGNAGNIYQRIHGRNRLLSWNFQNVTNPCGTIEFRRPPGVASAAEAIHWAGFALCFVAQALGTNWAHPDFMKSKTHPTVSQLYDSLKWGEERLHPLSRSALRPALAMEDRRPPSLLNVEEAIRVEMKQRDKNAEASPFAEKVCHEYSVPTMFSERSLHLN